MNKLPSKKIHSNDTLKVYDQLINLLIEDDIKSASRIYQNLTYKHYIEVTFKIRLLHHILHQEKQEFSDENFLSLFKMTIENALLADVQENRVLPELSDSTRIFVDQLCDLLVKKQINDAINLHRAFLGASYYLEEHENYDYLVHIMTVISDTLSSDSTRQQSANAIGEATLSMFVNELCRDKQGQADTKQNLDNQLQAIDHKISKQDESRPEYYQDLNNSKAIFPVNKSDSQHITKLPSVQETQINTSKSLIFTQLLFNFSWFSSLFISILLTQSVQLSHTAGSLISAAMVIIYPYLGIKLNARGMKFVPRESSGFHSYPILLFFVLLVANVAGYNAARAWFHVAFAPVIEVTNAQPGFASHAFYHVSTLKQKFGTVHEDERYDRNQKKKIRSCHFITGLVPSDMSDKEQKKLLATGNIRLWLVGTCPTLYNMKINYMITEDKDLTLYHKMLDDYYRSDYIEPVFIKPSEHPEEEKQQRLFFMLFIPILFNFISLVLFISMRLKNKA
jgi:hypothetical protein